MPWVKDLNPSQEILDQLMLDCMKIADKNCHDCGVSPGQAHLGGCDTARCLKCGGQRLSCDCKNGGGDIWNGLWPGTEECYEYGLVCHWEGPSPIGSIGWGRRLTFDYNAAALLKIKEIKKDKRKVCSFKNFLNEHFKKGNIVVRSVIY